MLGLWISGLNQEERIKTETDKQVASGSKWAVESGRLIVNTNATEPIFTETVETQSDK